MEPHETSEEKLSGEKPRLFPPVCLDSPDDAQEAELTHYGLCLIAEYLAEESFEMTFNPSYTVEKKPSTSEKFFQSLQKEYLAPRKGLSDGFVKKIGEILRENNKLPSPKEEEHRVVQTEPTKTTFAPSEEALLRLNRLDAPQMLRQIHYKYRTPTHWSAFCGYFRYVLYVLLKEDEYDTTTRKMIADIFDLAVLNSQNDSAGKQIAPLVLDSWIDSKCNSKFAAFIPQKYAQLVSDEQEAANRANEQYLENLNQMGY